ncbi:MAG: hypothetical protein JNK60_13985, partial [Acidobacteria bacterium]|nr:hypothetical protein [Acidobacteriota bacterium]
MLKSPARFLLAGAILGAALLGASPLAAEGRAFNVRTFPATRSSESIGDREAGANGAFWYGRDQYDNANGFYFPEVARLTPDGAATVWALDTVSQAFTPSQVRRNANTGVVWVVVPAFSERNGALYRLTPGTGEVVRTALPFVATRLHLDPLDGTPWVTGTGRIAKLSGGTLSVYEVENAEGRSGGIDASRRIWLTADNRSLRAFNVGTGTLEVWADAGAGMLDPVIDASGRVWGIGTGQTSVLRFDPATRELTRFPNPLTASNWARAGIGTDFVNMASSYGPHFLSLAPSKMPDSTSATLAAPASTTLTATTSTPATRTLTAATRQDQISPVDRTVYLENDGGRHLYTASAGYAALLWSNGGETLVGTGPLELWQALPAGQTFTTTAALPVAVEVRPEDPVNNFLTEVTVTNIDASPNVTLVLTTGSQSFSYPLEIPAGSSRVLPNVMDALRSADAPIPQGAVGTLVGRFVNGKGLLNARVYTKFGAGAPFPAGSTTGLGFTSLDPASRAGLYRTTLNGLKNTPGFRSNVAIANLCGFTGTPCATLEMSLDFFDDATGLAVGSKDLRVPPNQVAQLNAPLADFPGAIGETFSVIIQPYQSGFAN